MRILMLDHPQFTSGTYLLWHGLKELETHAAGALRVDIYPPYSTYYDGEKFDVMEQGWYRELDAMRERSLLPAGIPPFSQGEKLNYDDQRIIPRFELSAYFPHPGDLAQSLDEISKRVDQGVYNLIILGNGNRVPTMALAGIRNRVTKKLPPIVYYDAGERDELNEHWVHVFRPQLTWKQILPAVVKAKGLSIPTPGYNFQIMPLPLSSILVNQPDLKIGGRPIRDLREMDTPERKETDVFYILRPTCPERVPVISYLHDKVEALGLSTLPNQSYEQFHPTIAKTRMAVTMRGSGRDTHRYWEIPLYRTAMLADGTMGCIHPYPFEDMKTAVFWRDQDHLGELLARYKDPNSEDSKRLDAIALAGKEHLAKYHSTAARAMFFLHQTVELLSHGFPKIAPPLTRSWIERWRSSHGQTDRHWEGPVS